MEEALQDKWDLTQEARFAKERDGIISQFNIGKKDSVTMRWAIAQYMVIQRVVSRGLSNLEEHNASALAAFVWGVVYGGICSLASSDVLAVARAYIERVL